MNKNFFNILNIPIGFDINLTLLDKNYFILQTEFHPDKLSSIKEANKIDNLWMSARVNEAYITLKSPISRAAYLLKLQGIDLEQKVQKADNLELLEQSLEDREALEEIRNLEELTKFEELILVRQTIITQQFSAFYQAKEFNKAASAYIQLKYIVKLLEDISNKKRLIDNAIINNK